MKSAMLRWWRHAAVTCASIGVACTKVPPLVIPEPVDLTVQLPMDSTWARTLRALTSQRLTPSVADKTSGIIAVKDAALTIPQMREWITCRGNDASGLRKTSDMMFSYTGFQAAADISILIQGTEASSTVRPTVTITAKYLRGPLGVGGVSECMSNGTIEKAIADALVKR